MTYPYEFFWRGRGPSDSRSPDYHVILAEEVTIAGVTKEMIGDVMTPAQAAAAGFPLSAILGGINSAALAQVDALTADKATLQQQLATAQEAANAAQAEKAGLQSQIESLSAQLAVATAPKPTADISRQQCAMEMAAMGLISPAEMVAMAKDGTPPELVETLLQAMLEPDQSFARAAFAKATYSRSDPLLVQLMTGQPVPVEGGGTRPATADDIDQFFRDAALH